MTAYSKQPIADMTRGELERLIVAMLNQRLSGWPSQAQHIGEATPQTWQALLDNLIEPAAGEPSVLDTLLKERNRWYSST